MQLSQCYVIPRRPRVSNTHLVSERVDGAEGKDRGRTIATSQ